MSGKRNSGDEPDNAELEANQDAIPTDAPLSAGEEVKPEEGDPKPGDPKPEKNIGLHRFLQLSPQPSGVAALLYSKHIADAMPLSNWQTLVKDLLHKKVQ